VKTYRIDFAYGSLAMCLYMLGAIFFCLTIVGIPFVIMSLPTMYRIVEESETSD
jgi:hypothetical protein